MKYTMINPDLAKTIWARLQRAVSAAGNSETMRDYDIIRGEYYRMMETIRDYRAEEAKRNARD